MPGPGASGPGRVLVLGGSGPGGAWSGGLVPGGLVQGGAWWRLHGRLLLRAVRILLECILAFFTLSAKTAQRHFKRKIQIPQRASISNGLFPPPDSDSDSDSDTDSCTMQVFSLVQIKTLIP